MTATPRNVFTLRKTMHCYEAGWKPSLLFLAKKKKSKKFLTFQEPTKTKGQNQRNNNNNNNTGIIICDNESLCLVQLS